MTEIEDCRGFGAGYKDDYGVWHTYDNYCICSQCLRFNPEIENSLISFIGWDGEGPCEFRKLKVTKS